MLKGKQIVINKIVPQFFAYVFVADTFICTIGKLHHILMALIIFTGI